MGVVTKERQSAKIREIGQALANVGYTTVEQQSMVLGISRSTAWTVLKSCHKASGLSANLISRMLSAPGLPSAASEKITEYVRERLEGSYGHSTFQIRRFATRVSCASQTAAEVVEKLRQERVADGLSDHSH